MPGLLIDALKPAVNWPSARPCRCRSKIPWLSIAPIAASRSSYNGLLVFIFIIISGSLAASAIHRLASNALRRAPAWDCGFPEPSPATQYTAESFGQPIRRVFGGFAFGAREIVDMPAPGDLRPARYEAPMHDRIWRWVYTPIVRGVGAAATRLNALQFLTIRQYLSIVFGALIVLLLILAGAA